MIEKYNMDFRGDFRLSFIDKQGLETKNDWQHNEIIANAPILLSRLLGGQPFNLDRMVIKKAGALLAVADIIEVTYPSFEEVAFKAVFDYDSFNDTFDELQLVSSNGGTFSLVPDLNITKTDTQSMAIDWKIKLGICSNLWVPTTATYGLGGLPIFPPARITNIAGKDYLIP